MTCSVADLLPCQRVFGIFFVVSFVWFVIPNYFLPVVSACVMCAISLCITRDGEQDSRLESEAIFMTRRLSTCVCVVVQHVNALLGISCNVSLH